MTAPSCNQDPSILSEETQELAKVHSAIVHPEWRCGLTGETMNRNDAKRSGRLDRQLDRRITKGTKNSIDAGLISRALSLKPLKYITV